MKKILLGVLSGVLLNVPFYLHAQSKSTFDQLSKGRREIVLTFKKSDAPDWVSTSHQLSTDKITADSVTAYANKNQFEAFILQNIPFTLKKAPSLMLNALELNMKNQVSLNSKSTSAWDYYPTYTAYVSIMQQFASNFPNICRLDTIGTTVEGRLLLVVKISDNVATDEAEPEFFYTSSMHGDETTGYIMMLHLIDYLLTNYGSVSRVTNLVNNMEIYINPCANPDGTYAGGNTSVSGATRSNANGEDLNRNYPVPDGSAGDDGTYTQQIETQNFVTFIESRHFVMSANFHGGVELANYPWDFTSNDHADKIWWKYVSKEYADTAQGNSPAGYFDEEPSMTIGTADYPGVVEGYSWYPAPGSRQDYSQYFAQCREVTLEISDTKNPAANTLESYWSYNYKSILNYMEQAQYGIRGMITDVCTGQGVKALVTVTSHDADSSQVYSSPLGDYYRPIASGTWTISVSAPGYQTATVNNITTTNKTAQIRNITLSPIAPDAAFTADVTSTCTGEVHFSNTSTYAQGSTLIWTFGDGTVSNEANPVHYYTTNGTFTVKLKIVSCAGNDSLVRTSYISVAMPAAPLTTGATICGGNTADLSASGSGTLNWYDAQTQGNLVASGTTFTTPLLYTTTNYYVTSESSTLGAAQHVGMTNNSGGGQYFSGTSNYRYTIFDVSQPLRLESVKVYAQTAGDRTILLQNSSGTTINSVTVNIPTGQNPYLVTLNFDIPVGTGYRLGVETGSNNNLYIASGPSYPYTINSVISITGNNQNQSYLYFFFDWIVKTMSSCSSPRTEVTATVNPLPVAGFTYNINGTSVNFTNNGTNGSSFNWNFGDGAVSTEENPIHTYATDNIYTVTMIASNACGNDTTDQQIDLIHAALDEYETGKIHAAMIFNDVWTMDLQSLYGETRFEIYASDGHMIEKGTLANQQEGKVRFNTSSWAKGFYYVKVENNMQSYFFKGLKQ